MGRVSAPFGVKGWIKVQPFTAEARNLLDYATWWIGRDDDWQEHRVTRAQVSGRAVLAKLEGCDDRDTAARSKGEQVAVPRDALPEPAADEYYWADLIGLEVVNTAAQDLGCVVRILQTGANDVLVVQGECERLIPFIADVVKRVDLAGRAITVDWSSDY